MNTIRSYKIIAYIVLLLVVIISFAITDFLLNITKESFSPTIIALIVLNLLLNFSMFYIIFRYSNQLIEKEAAINEFTRQLNKINEPAIASQEETDMKDVNVDDLVNLVVPQSPQNYDRLQFAEKVLANSAKICELVQGLFFIKDSSTGEFNFAGKYAFYSETVPKSFVEGETLSGQVAKTKKIISITDIPENYFTVISGLGNGVPNHLLIVPIVNKDETIGIIELATFKPFDEIHIKAFEKLSGMLGKILIKLK